MSEYFPAEKTTQGLLNIYEKFFNLEFKIVKPDYAWLNIIIFKNEILICLHIIGNKKKLNFIIKFLKLFV